MSDFSPESIARIQRVIPYVERSMKNTLPRRARWHGGGSKTSPIITVGGVCNRFSLFGYSGTEYTGTVPGSVALTYADLTAEAVWMVAFTNDVPSGFPVLTGHPLFEWQEADDYNVHSLSVKQDGVYRLSLEYSVDVTFTPWSLSTENTGTADYHVHTYSRAPEIPGQITLGLCLATTTDDLNNFVFLQAPWNNGYTYMNTVAGTLVTYRAYAAGSGIPVYLSWLTALFEETDKIDVGYLRLTVERVGEYVAP